MRDPASLSPRLYLSLHRGGPNRDCPIQLIPRHCTSRHLLRSSPLPLCPLHRSRICNHGWVCTLIPPLFRVHPPQHLVQNPFWGYIPRGQPHILPPTLPRPSRNTTTILRLPRRLRSLKHCLLYRFYNFHGSSYHIPIHSLRSICRQTRSTISRTNRHKRRMTTRLPSPLPHI